DLGSPIFDEITIDAPEAKLKIKAEGAGGKAKYIKSAELSGKTMDLEHPVLNHEDLYKNGVLNLEMSVYKAW
ncbi:MAG: glycoside hydrolase family 92 protein, partial [Oscillospiraceae bacterium]|nr:glycoside hydrolase family 92 protein [Oscillospiraceae bacterium]